MIQFTENERNLGTIKVGEEFKFEVPVTSTEKTFVKSIRVSCGCTVPELIGNPISPEKESVLKVSFTPKSTGYSKKSIWLGFDDNSKRVEIDKNNKEIKFDFTAKVI